MTRRQLTVVWVCAVAALVMAVNAVFQFRSGGLWLLSMFNVAGFSWLAYRTRKAAIR